MKEALKEKAKNIIEAFDETYKKIAHLREHAEHAILEIVKDNGGRIDIPEDDDEVWLTCSTRHGDIDGILRSVSVDETTQDLIVFAESSVDGNVDKYHGYSFQTGDIYTILETLLVVDEE